MDSVTEPPVLPRMVKFPAMPTVAWPMRLLLMAALLSRTTSPPPRMSTLAALEREPFGPLRMVRPEFVVAAVFNPRTAGAEVPF